MAQEIIMPKTGMAMREGTIIAWHIKEGDTITKGDLLAEIETDKTTMEYESDYDGTVLRIVYPAGTTVKVTYPIAFLGAQGEKVPDIIDMRDGISEVTPSSRNTQACPLFPPSNNGTGKIKATPRAKRIAKEQQLDISTLTPSGIHDVIKERDVILALTEKKNEINNLQKQKVHYSSNNNHT